MRVALIASRYADERGGVAGHVDRLARGLVRRGAEVEITALGDLRQPAGGGTALARRIPIEPGRLRFAVASPFWRALKFAADGSDVVDVHISELPLTPPSVSLELGPMILTPHMPVQRLRRWPYSRAIGTLISASHRIICTSRAERNLLVDAFPRAAGRAEVLPTGVDELPIHAATPFPTTDTIMVTTARLERDQGLERAIAALASLDPGFRLVIVGDGPERRRLEAFAADLRVHTRVTFAGALPDALRYRWLRTARVVAALPIEDGSGAQIMEALTAGAAVVASDIPVHREVVEQVPGGRVFFVTPEGSPLDVADAVDLAAQVAAQAAACQVPSWDSVIERTWEVYRQVALDPRPLRTTYVPAHHIVADADAASSHNGALA